MTIGDAIRVSNKGVLLAIHVTPGFSQTVFPAGYNTWRKSIEIKVKAEAKDNKANNEVIKTLAIYFKIPITSIQIISGQKSREKTVCIQNIQHETVLLKLEESVHGL